MSHRQLELRWKMANDRYTRKINWRSAVAYRVNDFYGIFHGRHTVEKRATNFSKQWKMRTRGLFLLVKSAWGCDYAFLLVKAFSGRKSWSDGSWGRTFPTFLVCPWALTTPKLSRWRGVLKITSDAVMKSPSQDDASRSKSRKRIWVSGFDVRRICLILILCIIAERLQNCNQ